MPVDDAALRVRLFAHVDELVRQYGTPLSHTVLKVPFTGGPKPISLLNQVGIYRPSYLGDDGAALIIMTGVKGRYADDFAENDEIIKYRYQDGDPDNYYNRSMRFAMARRSPLLYLVGVAPGTYLPLYPCFVESDNRAEQYFEILVGNPSFDYVRGHPEEVSREVRRYETYMALRRLHQADFRADVLEAYKTQCAICRLKIPTLLDAAHIIPDGEPDGNAIVPNGLALCKIHHAAYDRSIIGITPDYRVEVATVILNQTDGPMLQHGLKEIHNVRLHVPRSAVQQPDPNRLQRRHERFVLHWTS